MKKLFLYIFVYTIISIVILPASVTFIYSIASKNDKQDIPVPKEEVQTPAPAVPENVETEEISIPIDDSNTIVDPETLQIINEELEKYLKGVVGAEMPVLFGDEALKAQAVAARTYAVRQIEYMSEKGLCASPSDIGQAYNTISQLKAKWGDNFEPYYNKISNAVDSTKGEIMVYNDEPILAVFHSTSAGITENAENVWTNPVPYLKSVDSSLDKNAPNFEHTETFTAETFISKMKQKYNDIVFTSNNIIEQVKIIERTQADYVKTIQVGNKTITGKQFREVLGLRSSDFTIKQSGNGLEITTKGYGHGAGMSQYGAGFMADEGYSYQDILKHYYTGIEIVKRN